MRIRLVALLMVCAVISVARPLSASSLPAETPTCPPVASEETQNAYSLWNLMVYEEITNTDLQIEIGDEIIYSGDLKNMTTDERIEIADRWVEQYDALADLRAYWKLLDECGQRSPVDDIRIAKLEARIVQLEDIVADLQESQTTSDSSSIDDPVTIQCRGGTIDASIDERATGFILTVFGGYYGDRGAVLTDCTITSQ